MSRIKKAFNKTMSKINTAFVEKEKSSNVAVQGAFGILGATSALAASSTIAFAKKPGGGGGGGGALKNIFDRFKATFHDLYDNFYDIAAAAVTVVSVGCLLAAILLKNDRKVEMFMNWMKRAWIAFVALRAFTYVLEWLEESGGDEKVENAW